MDLEYFRLGEDALDTLEADYGLRAHYLELLTYFQDLLSSEFPVMEPALFRKEDSNGRINALISEIPFDSGVQKFAAKNYQVVVGIIDVGDKKSALVLMEEILREYNVVRLLRSRGGVRARK